ncbi:D-lactonohydrolase-like protein [Mycena kentingensis (nom. inval.)]|nr:D-lactonohydrolase-like protein [Mycena kentingensis (nom. inval.)]
MPSTFPMNASDSNHRSSTTCDSHCACGRAFHSISWAMFCRISSVSSAGCCHTTPTPTYTPIQPETVHRNRISRLLTPATAALHQRRSVLFSSKGITNSRQPDLTSSVHPHLLRSLWNDVASERKAVPGASPLCSLHSTPMLFLLLLALGAVATSNKRQAPNQSVFLDRVALNVLGPNGDFRNDSVLYNPTNATAPVFQIFDPAFLDILGPNPSLRLIASNESFAFAHEAPVWIPETGEVFFCSDQGGTRPIHSDNEHDNVVSKISLQEALDGGNVTVTTVPLDPAALQITNGGTNYKGQILLVNAGRANFPPNVVVVNPRPPYNSTIHPGSKKIFFTDKATGWQHHFRPLPDFPNMVYRFDPDTGSVRVVADGLFDANGIAFSADGKFAFVGDSGLSEGFVGANATRPATIYQYDVDPDSQTFTNRRLFAYIDKGTPDGIQLDTKGNLYIATGDGVNVFNPLGDLLGKIYLGDSSANMIFTQPGKLIVLSDSNLFFAEIAAEGQDLHGLGMSV